MNLFRKQFRNFTNCRFDIFSNERFVNFQPRFSGAFRIGFARNLQSHLISFKQIIFPLVEIVSASGKQLRHWRQVQSQLRQTLQIRTRARQYAELYRDTARCCHYLNTNAKEVTALARHFSSIPLIADYATSFNPNVVADRYRERIKQIAEASNAAL